MSLFPTDSFYDLNLEDAGVLYYPNIYSSSEADKLYKVLLEQVSWQQDTIKVFGKNYLQPRLTAFYSENEKTLNYSNISMRPHPFFKELNNIKNKAQEITSEFFTSCLLNLYRDGKDSNGWHADDEKELGINPVIASVSLGEARMFHFKHKTKSLKHKILLEHGSMLLMKGQTQHYWLHQIPKTKRQIGSRINITFRTVK